MNPANSSFTRRLTLVILTCVVIALGTRGCADTKPDNGSDATQTTFSSPEEAVQSLITSMRAHDAQKLEQIFGPDSDDLLFSGDNIADQQTQDRFLEMYDQKHSLKPDKDNNLILTLGDDEWPMPIPVVKDESGKAWLFDTAAGQDEIINRRIGRNELNVIQVCKAIGDAQREYAQRDPNGDGVPEYARKFLSDTGTKNGLYWDVAPGEETSPLGLLVAAAQAEGYSKAATPTGEPRPYHGYLYRILTAQGKDATGGAQDYVVDGKLIGGFAVVAWPAEYGSSGVKTFITNYTGDVFETDLGDDTDKLARAMTEYNPGSAWKKSE